MLIVSLTEILISKNISTNHCKGQLKKVLKLVGILVGGQFFVALAFRQIVVRKYNHVQARSSQFYIQDLEKKGRHMW